MTDHKARNAQILDALKDESPKAVAEHFGLSSSYVYRIRSDSRRNGHGADTFQNNARPTGPVFSEIGTTGLRQFAGNVDEDYDRVFKPLYRKVQLYKEMGDDPIAAAVLMATKMTIRRLSWSVEPAGETRADEQAAEFLDGCMNDMSLSWADAIDNALDMLQYGFALFELVYKRRQGEARDPASKYDDGKIGWRKWTFIGQDTLAQNDPWLFDEHGGIQGFRQQDPNTGASPVEIPMEKALLFRTTSRKNDPEGRAILRAMYPPWYMKKNLEEIEAISAERFGSGLPVVYLGSDTSRTDSADSDLTAYKNIVRNIRVDEQMGVVNPYAKMGGGALEGQGVLVELLTPSGGRPVVLDTTIQRYEKRMAMVGLAQFIHLGMDKVGTQALAGESVDFFTLSVAAWADLIEETIHRFGTERLFKLNHFPGLTGTPRIVHSPVFKQSLIDIATYIEKMTGAGLLTADPEFEAHVRQLADLPEKPVEVIRQQQEEAELRKEQMRRALEKKEGEGTTDRENGTDKEGEEREPGAEEAAEYFADVPGGIMVAFPIDKKIASKIVLPDGEGLSELHITLAFLGKVGDLSKEQRDRLLGIIRGFAMINRPLSGTITGPGEFAEHDGKKPVVLLVDIPGLPAWRQRLVEVLTLNGYAVATDHGYIPHITLKYADKNEDVSLNVPPIPVTFDKIMLVINGKRSTYKLGGGEPLEGTPEVFQSDLRGGRPGRPPKAIAHVNAYQREIEDIYTEWSADLARDLAGTEDDDRREEILAAALAALLLKLRQEGREQMAAWLANVEPTPEVLQALADAVAENDRLLEQSLIPAIEQKVRTGLRDEDILKALALGTGAAALAGLLSTSRARVALYAGGLWSFMQRATGMTASERGNKVVAHLDVLAQHCSECPQFHAVGGREYASFEEYLRTTGGRVPGEFECKGNCRCWLEMGGE